MANPKPVGTAVALIPEGFGVVGPVTLPEQTRTPYVQFVSEKSRNYGDILTKLPGIKIGSPVLIQGAPQVGEGEEPLPPPHPLRLDPFDYFLLHATEFWGQFNQNGELLAMTKSKPDNATSTQPKFDQTIETVLLVVAETPDGVKLLPATCRFKATKCPAVYCAIRSLTEAKTAGWAKKGEEYAFTMKIPQPWARFYTRAVRCERTNRERGTVYAAMEAAVHPTNTDKLDKIVSFFQNKANVEMLAEVTKAYRARLEQIAKKQLVPA